MPSRPPLLSARVSSNNIVTEITRHDQGRRVRRHLSVRVQPPVQRRGDVLERWQQHVCRSRHSHAFALGGRVPLPEARVQRQHPR